MTGLLIFDIVMAASIVILAVAALRAANLFQAIVTFIVFGLLMALAWTRLRAFDLALAEAVIGAGISGALLLGALSRIERFGKRPAGELAHPIGAFTSRTAWAILMVTFTGCLLSMAVIALWHEGPSLRETVQDHMPASGVINPVTAVILNFRAYDTLLEIAVLLIAGISAYAVAGKRVSGPRAAEQPCNPVLNGFVRLLVPAVIITAAYLVWVGYKAPGGAFQAGALLGGLGVTLLIAGRTLPLRDTHGAVRFGLAAGLLVFLLTGTALLWRGKLLEYPTGQAKNLILLIEIACTISIGGILSMLFAACAGRIQHDGNPET